MIVVEVEKIFSLRATNRFGLPSGFGEGIFSEVQFGDQPEKLEKNPFGTIIFGQDKFGDILNLRGIYQRKHTKKGVQISKSKFYVPKNPHSIPQENWRTVFREAVAAWEALDSETKEIYNLKARPLHFQGRNYFYRQYLNSHKI